MPRKSENIIGKKYGKLTVIKQISNSTHGNKYLCKCECGNEKEVIKSNLKSGRTTSCGCARKKPRSKLKINIEKIVVKKESDLTADNYYSVESNIKYVSASQYSDFFGHRLGLQKGCECYALAKMRGEVTEPITTPMIVGSYVDAYFEGTLDKFVAEHPEILSTRGETKGELKSDYKQADTMIKRAERDPLFMKYMAGDKQVIMTGEIEGIKCKIKIDSTDGNRITDLKTVKNLHETFFVQTSGERVNFIEWWQYDRQLALYREIYRQNTGEKLPCFICAISKDKTDRIPHPRIAVIEIPPQQMDARLIEIKQNITHIQCLKDKVYDPVPCGSCDYCADTLPIDRVIAPDELMLEM